MSYIEEKQALNKANERAGELNIGLTRHQELQWLSAIKLYGKSILDKSLLSQEQKTILLALSYKT